MKKSKIYTKTGDRGETSLVGGERRLKSDHKIDLYGDVDELNSHLGFGLSLLTRDSSIFQNEINHLSKIQHILFDLGSNLACEASKRLEYKLPQIPEKAILDLEESMDNMNMELDELKNFILPGGSEASSYFQIIRAVTRKVERKLIAFEASEELPEKAVIFMNRLSDYFFLLSRYINKKLSHKEILWSIGSYS